MKPPASFPAPIDLPGKIEEVRPTPVPIPIPDFSLLPVVTPMSVMFNLLAAPAHGFSPAGAREIYSHGKLPTAPGDQLRLARISHNPAKTFVSMSPGIGFVLVPLGPTDSKPPRGK